MDSILKIGGADGVVLRRISILEVDEELAEIRTAQKKPSGRNIVVMKVNTDIF